VVFTERKKEVPLAAAGVAAGTRTLQFQLESKETVRPTATVTVVSAARAAPGAASPSGGAGGAHTSSLPAALVAAVPVFGARALQQLTPAEHPHARLLAAVLDLSARAKEVTGLRAVEIYERGPSTLAARMEMGLAVYQARFHVTYAWDEAAGWCTWELDPRHPNDITDTAGSYQVLPQGSGTRLVYRSHSGGGAMTPDWLKRKLAYSAAGEMLSGMRTRAERGG
jgi:hypothetical protein